MANRKKIILAILIFLVCLIGIFLYFWLNSSVSSQVITMPVVNLEEEQTSSTAETVCFKAQLPFSVYNQKKEESESKCNFMASRKDLKGKLTISYEEKDLISLDDFASVNMRNKDNNYQLVNMDLKDDKSTKVFKTSSELVAFIKENKGVSTVALYDLSLVDDEKLSQLREIIASLELKSLY